MSEDKVDIGFNYQPKGEAQSLKEVLYKQLLDSVLFSEYSKQKIDERRQAVRKQQPYFLLKPYSPILQEGFRLVRTELIVGGVPPSFNFWGDEYPTRRGRHELIINEMLSAARKEREAVGEALNHIFHIDDGRRSERIRLIKIEGTVGPVYFVGDGTHRVSVAKGSGLGRDSDGSGGR